MRIPRNESGKSLITKLSSFGYRVSRQTGSHIRLTRQYNNKSQHITIPNHDPIRVGTLHSLLKQVAIQVEISKEDLIHKLYFKE